MKRFGTPLWTAALLVIAAVAVLGWCRDPEPATGLSEAVAAEVARLRADSVRTHAALDSLRAGSRAAAETATGTVEGSAVPRATADSMARLAAAARTAADSAARWQAAYEARTAERDSLARALAFRQQALDLAWMEADTARAYATRLEDFNARLVRDLEASEPRCTLPLTFGRVGCPSRTETGIGAAIVAAVATAIIAEQLDRDEQRIVVETPRGVQGRP